MEIKNKLLTFGVITILLMTTFGMCNAEQIKNEKQSQNETDESNKIGFMWAEIYLKEGEITATFTAHWMIQSRMIYIFQGTVNEDSKLHVIRGYKSVLGQEDAEIILYEGDEIFFIFGGAMRPGGGYKPYSFFDSGEQVLTFLSIEAVYGYVIINN